MSNHVRDQVARRFEAAGWTVTREYRTVNGNRCDVLASAPLSVTPRRVLVEAKHWIEPSVLRQAAEQCSRYVDDLTEEGLQPDVVLIIGTKLKVPALAEDRVVVTDLDYLDTFLEAVTADV